jgi:glyoxylase-like metal-dependent hydrolase (beta-lactamase superfamily II)
MQRLIKLFVLTIILLGLLVILARHSTPVREFILHYAIGYVPPHAQPVGAIAQVADHLYLVPDAGGNTAVFVTGQGVVLIDTKMPGSFASLMEQVRTVTDKPVIMAINTHFHVDHVGGNSDLPPGTEIVMQENTLRTMEKIWRRLTLKNLLTPHWSPTRTFRDRLTLFSGADTIDLYHFGPAHTAGDLAVVFRSARVLHAGDVYSSKAAPIINEQWGGNGANFPHFLKALGSIPDVDRIITGHDTMMTRDDLNDYFEFCQLLQDHARREKAAGHTEAQAVEALELPDKFRNYHVERMLSTVRELYRTLEAPAQNPG